MFCYTILWVSDAGAAAPVTRVHGQNQVAQCVIGFSFGVLCIPETFIEDAPATVVAGLTPKDQRALAIFIEY
ncbi:MAG: hypothetical protein AAFV19_21065 [Pseudomonadota bacterium]